MNATSSTASAPIVRKDIGSARRLCEVKALIFEWRGRPQGRGYALLLRGVSGASQRKQLDLMQRMNELHARGRDGDPQLEARIQSLEMAFRMQTAATDAFDLNRETTATRDLYGRGQFADACLVARRLVERPDTRRSSRSRRSASLARHPIPSYAPGRDESSRRPRFGRLRVTRLRPPPPLHGRAPAAPA